MQAINNIKLSGISYKSNIENNQKIKNSKVEATNSDRNYSDYDNYLDAAANMGKASIIIDDIEIPVPGATSRPQLTDEEKQNIAEVKARLLELLEDPENEYLKRMIKPVFVLN